MVDDSQTTRRARILVVIDAEGKWEAVGSHSWSDDEARKQSDEIIGDLSAPPWAYYWVEADILVPIQRAEDAIEGVVTDAIIN